MSFALTSTSTTGTLKVNGQDVLTVDASGEVSLRIDGVLVPLAELSTIKKSNSIVANGAAAYDFSVPQGVKRVTLAGLLVSTNTTAIPIVQLGNGTPQTTGYQSTCGHINNSGLGAVVSTTSGFIMFGASASDTRSFVMTLTNLEGDTWLAELSSYQLTSVNAFGIGFVTLSGALDVLRLTADGSALFDNPSSLVAVSWEF